VIALLLALIVGVACDRDEPTVPAHREETPCPAGLKLDSARAERVLTLLTSVEAGRGVHDRARAPFRLCFGPRDETAVTADGAVLLDTRVPEAESAARLGHLLLHFVDGVRPEPLPTPDPDVRSCESAVEESVAAEARAHALELELRKALGVTHPARTFPFENEFWTTPPTGRDALLRARFLGQMCSRGRTFSGEKILPRTPSSKDF
jgi:hypothetical protein